MSCEERKVAIVKAVLPVFARNGFARTTTKQLATAAGVSEALLYKHFPSKESLYAEIQSYGCQGCDPELESLLSEGASTRTLVQIVYYAMRANILGRPCDKMCSETRHRMILNSCLEDGDFTRYLFRNHFADHMASIVACLDAAVRVGDLVQSPARKQNLLLFVHHLATMIATMRLPKQPVVDYAASRDELLNQAVWFALRGIGMKDEAIRHHFRPKELSATFRDRP